MQDPKKDEPTEKPTPDTPAAEPAGPAAAGTAKAAGGTPAPDAKKPTANTPPATPSAKTPEVAKPSSGDAASEAVTKAIPMQKGSPDKPDAATVKMHRTSPPQAVQGKTGQGKNEAGKVDPAESETVAIPVTKSAVPPTPPPPRPAQAPPAQPPARPQQAAPPRQAASAQQPPDTRATPPPAPPRPKPKAAPQRVLPPQQSAPQRVGPAEPAAEKHGKAWLLAAIAAGLIVIAAIAVAGVVVYNNNRAENSPEAQVQGTIDTFVAALTQGDLATLRTSTCGGLAEYYQGISDQDFAEVHQVAITQQNIPVVGKVDAVQITDDTAIAQVKAHTAANPNEQSWRTFNLEKVEGTWKVCDPR
ncbi:Rv0361 family membrane protein [Rhodococcus tibetensis]|uniref:Transcriptional regulator n=1 Tax=Rhodococcus tibetensis TaxID=2965064 RepID=A0ABT1QAJ7_9NOCA|nr:transcriptional regulator [Rhodococcus sp. FXJ9.536]MCQ4118152.1 transcriptional regulator [Rhodococcus sp. FXJ9.536]